MNPGPPLPYDSLKKVLQYMNPNLRISLSINCPSIRSAEKAVPFKIKKLEFTDQSFIADDMEYKVGIYKKYAAGTCPPRVNEVNGDGGLSTDLDQHGYKDWPSRLTLRPGDVDLRSPYKRSRVYEQINEVEIKSKEEELREIQERLDYVESLGPIIISEANKSYSLPMLREIAWYFHRLEISEELSAHYSTQPEFEHARAKIYEYLKGKVLDTKAILHQWYARRDGLPVPFESYIMLTISNDETKEKKKIEFIKYEKRLPEALNYLVHRIFENRRHPAAVKLLIPQSDILRLTPGLRMEIEEMQFDGEVDRAFAAMAPYIEDSSYPLKCLKVFAYHPSIFQLAKLRSAKHLVVVAKYAIERLPICLNFDNHQVQVMNYHFGGLIPVDDLMTLILHWVSSGKEFGASFSYRLEVANDYDEIDDFHEEVLKRIKAQFKNSFSEHRYSKIPTDYGTTLKVSLEKSDREFYPWDIVLQIFPLAQ